MQDAAGGNAVLQPFTVATGKSVSAASVMNLSGGEIGANPVVNTATTTITEGSDSFDAINESGTVGVRAYNNGSGHHCVETYVISDGAITSQGETVVYTGYGDCGATAKSLGGNKFAMTGNNLPPPTGGTGYAYGLMFSVNASGDVSASLPKTVSRGGAGHPTWAEWTQVDVDFWPVDPVNDLYVMREYWYYYNAGGFSSDEYNYVSFANSGTITTSGSADSSAGWAESACKTVDNSKVIAWKDAGEFYVSDFNGTAVSNKVTVAVDAFGRDAKFFRPNPNADSFLVTYINNINQLVVATYSYSGGSLSKVADSAFIVIDDASGATTGGIAATPSGLVVTYENGFQGYVDSFLLDANYVVIGRGLTIQVNSTNYAPNIQYSGASDLYRLWWNEATANVRKLTVNAYSTSELIPIGISSEAGTGGEVINTVVDGIASGFTGLTVDALYYYDTSLYDGSITTTNTGTLVGRAISTTELKVML
jgi:hypothetical protein